VVAKGTPGFSGADLANLINEAALLAARADKDLVGMEDLEAAKDKVMMGAERRSMVITEDEKKVTAYHEAGHALVAMMIPGADPVHKVSIIPRGRALGVTMYLPTEEKYSETKEGLLISMCALLGGRAAEEIFLGNITTGASNDIDRVSSLAHKMVCEWGMSDKLGTISFGEKEGEVFLGKDMGHVKNYSEATAQIIDEEVSRLVSESYAKTQQILRDNSEILEQMAQELLEKETIDAQDIARIMSEQTGADVPDSVDEEVDA